MQLWAMWAHQMWRTSSQGRLVTHPWLGYHLRGVVWWHLCPARRAPVLLQVNHFRGTIPLLAVHLLWERPVRRASAVPRACRAQMAAQQGTDLGAQCGSLGRAKVRRFSSCERWMHGAEGSEALWSGRATLECVPCVYRQFFRSFELQMFILILQNVCNSISVDPEYLRSTNSLFDTWSGFLVRRTSFG